VVAAGGRLGYSITVSNTAAASIVNNVVVRLVIPTGVSVVTSLDANPDATSTNGCYAGINCSAGNEVFWSLGNLAAGASVTIDVSATVAVGVVPGTLIETPVTVSADGLGDGIRLQRSAKVIAVQKVFLSLAPSKDPVAPGESFTYVLNLGNASEDALGNAGLSLQLPAGVTATSISNSGTQSGNTITWNVASVAPAAAVTRSVTVTLSGSAVEAATLDAVAQLRYDGGLELDQEVHGAVTVSAPLKLAVDYRLQQGVVAAGGRLGYTITVSNTAAASIVNNVVVRLVIPTGVSFVTTTDANPDATSTNGCYAGINCSAGNEVFWSLGNLAAGASVTIDVNANVAAGIVPGTLIETPVTVSADGLGDSIRLQRSASVKTP
jgi:uncharacterized repeat protein (TIGR01451 family)